MLSRTHILDHAIKKALQSHCIYKISALAFNKKKEFLGSAFNDKRFEGKGKGFHAEERIIQRYGTSIKTIYICRVNPSGQLCPIDPCVKCRHLAKKYNIQIISLS